MPRRLLDLAYSGEGLGVDHTRVRGKYAGTGNSLEVKEKYIAEASEASEASEAPLWWAGVAALPPDQRAWWGRLGLSILATHSPSVKVLAITT